MKGAQRKRRRMKEIQKDTLCESRGLSFNFRAMSNTGVASRPITRGVAAAARSASNYAQNAFTAPARGLALDAAVESDSKLMTPERAGGRHRSPHGGDGNIDPFVKEDPWKSPSLQLSPAIIEAKRRVQMMRDTFERLRSRLRQTMCNH